MNAKMAQSCILLPDTAGQKQLWEAATQRQFVQLQKKAKLMEKKHHIRCQVAGKSGTDRHRFLFRNKGVAGWRWVVGDPSEFLNIASRFMVFAVHGN